MKYELPPISQFPNRNVIACAGAGGVGKTVVIEGVSKIMREFGILHDVQPSVVRSFYASYGIKDENAMKTMSGPDKTRFQFALAQYFLDNIKERSLDTKGFLLCDRSIFDHWAYWVFNGLDDIKLEDFKEYEKLINEYAKLLHTLVYFPYPVSWSKNKDPDSFRWAPPGKNFIIATLIRDKLDWGVRKRVIGQYKTMMDMDVEDRVDHMLSMIEGDRYAQSNTI